MAAAPITPQPDDGFGIYLNWGILQWVLGGVWVVGMAIAGWVWSIASKVEATREEVKMLREIIRRQDELIKGLQEKLDSLGEELPSRSFIEGQISQLSLRIDRLIDSKLARGAGQ